MNKQFVTTLTVILLAGYPLLAQETVVREDIDATITHLLDVVTKSGCTFIRNGQQYTGAQASDHMRIKYKHFKDQIKTPEDFIRLAATESLLTGEPYKIKTQDGQETPCATWMKTLLTQYRQHEKDQPKNETTNSAPRIGG